MRTVLAFDGEFGLGIDRCTLLEQALQNLARIAVLEQRAVAFALHARQKDVHGRLDPDRHGPILHSGSRFGIDERPAARRQHMRRLTKQPVDDLAFAVAKGGFTFSRVASLRPIELLPAPIIPTNAMVRLNSAISSR